MTFEEKINKAKLALHVLDPNTIKNRAIGQCKECGEGTSSSTDKFCKPCAVGFIEDVLDTMLEHRDGEFDKLLESYGDLRERGNEMDVQEQVRRAKVDVKAYHIWRAIGGQG